MRMGINPMSFSCICKSCGQFLEYHSTPKLKQCNDKLKSKGGNLDAYL